LKILKGAGLLIYAWKIVVALLAVMVIFSLSSMIPAMLQSSGLIAPGSFFTPAWTHLLMALFSFLIIILHGTGKFADFGLRSCTLDDFRAPLLWALIGGVFIQFILYLIVPSFIGKSVGPSADYSLLQTILFVWILASFAEEILFRGLIQGLLSPLSHWRFSLGAISLSMPVIIAALLFGLVHLGLLTVKVEAKYVLVIVAGAVVVGLVAGFFREKTWSLWPAVAVHALFNITGSGMASLLKVILK